MLAQLLKMTFLASALTMVCSADIFVMPFSGDLYLTPLGGSAGASTTFGIGTSPSTFTPYFTGLPNFPSSTAEVLVGYYSAGKQVIFGMETFFGGTYWAFSNQSDPASLDAFTDTNNSLGWGGKITEQTSPTTWVLHLDDAASYMYDDDDNDVLMQIRIDPTASPVPEPNILVLVAGLCLMILSAKRQWSGR